jgi:hypothetical protein
MRSSAALLLVLLVVSPAVAKPGKKAEAKLHYDAAITAYKAGDYDKAIEEFELGYAIAPEPQQLYNLAQACRLGKKLEKARDYYHKYLDAVPDATNREVVMTRIQEVEKEIEDAKKPPPPAAAPAPEPAPAPSPTPAPTAAPDLKGPFKPRTPYAVGLYIRPAFVTEAMLAPYLDVRTSMESAMVGAQFIYRRRTFDVVTSLDFTYLPVRDGNYLGKGNPPDLDTKYVEFRSLSFLSADVAILGHNNLTRWLEIFYGAGLGIGIVFGDVLVTTNFTGCTAANAADIAACHPLGVDLTSPNREQQLAATEAPGQRDTAQNPHRHSAPEKPPVMGVLNIQAGFRFRLAPRWTLQVEGGFRNAAFVGVGGHYWF